jgi:hypothetical protein
MDLQTMWQTLKECLDRVANENSPVILRECLYIERYDSEESIITFISRILNYREQLEDTT